ncbi:asparagine synthetase domain-containing protein 1 [Diachasma alloeum]|uniref:asparagine synthetase domain-containing protein 1 n=1 Tax=Diachasma alloeum TaxID=454923 RepID=UPI00073822CA|nr:asparagine synthetase domain-containing protein 1 [Diachasma alloeum]
MCGIFCLFEHWTDQELQQGYSCCECMDLGDCSTNNRRRGPDDLRPVFFGGDMNGKWNAEFRGWVLWTQGSSMTPQPFREVIGNVLLWNGDIFSGPLAQDSISDTEHLYTALESSGDILHTLGSVEGPFSFIYYDQPSESLYFGRDSIGRHSLLIKIEEEKRRLIISSVASKSLEKWREVPALGVYMLDLKRDDLNLTLVPWREAPGASDALKERLGVDVNIKNAVFSTEKNEITAEPLPEDSPFFSLISGIDDRGDVMENLLADPKISKRVDEVLKRLRESVRLRVEKKPDYCRNCIESRLRYKTVNCTHPKIGLLFSGGLDSTILAAIAHEFLPAGESIDLINVAFEKAEKENRTLDKKGWEDKIEQRKKEINFEVPDRKTGRQAWEELKRISPGREWNFVESNVTQKELEECLRTRICHVVHPLRTILDESLGCALWFAARGSGALAGTNKSYESPCRILLLGMGADELFGGYTRHRTILKRSGWVGLAKELETEIKRISERNLGRDDRVVSDHGKQSRLPYLDDNFVRFVTSLKPWERCCPVEHLPPGIGDKLLLRLCAFKLGLKETSHFPKRAFQFGSRIAKSHENASDISKWL